MTPERLTRSRTALLVGAVSLPFLVGLVQVLVAARHPFYTWGDQAFIDMSIQQALAFEQLRGPYSRMGWNHPGPLYYYLLAPTHLLFGSPIRLYFGALILNWAAATASVLLAVRYAGRRTASCLVIALLVLLGLLGPSFLRDPWNPAVVVLPLFAAVLAVALRSSTATNCVAVVGGSLAVQAHIGLLTPVAVLAVVGVLVFVAVTLRWEGGTPGDLVPRPRAVLVVGALFGVCWFAPITEQLSNGADGNLLQLTRFLLSSEAPQRGLRGSADHVATALWPSSPFSDQPAEVPFAGTTVVLAALVLSVGGAVIAWKRRERTALVLCAYAAAVLPPVTLSVSRMVGPVHGYLLWWLPAVVATLLAGLLVLGFGSLGPGLSRRRRTSRWLLGAVVFLGSGTAAMAFGVKPMAHISRPPVEDSWELVERYVSRGMRQVPMRIG